MQWDVDLLDPFSYSEVGIWFIVAAVVILVIVLIIEFMPKKKVVKPVVEKPIDINKVKKEYLSRIDNLIKKINENAITKRKAYNELSLIIREFIFVTTKIDVLKYTLADAKKTGNEELIKLLTEYYEPEFSKEGKGDLNTSIENTRKVIEEWK